MPEHPKFGSLSDKDAKRIFRYLVGLAKKDLLYRGFMLVLDRRREKWETVKSCLNKVQKCFPAKISLICLIKPQGFSQECSKPGFVTDGIVGDAKIQVVSLNSVAELDGYIEKSQLTEDVGGTLDYRHNEWVQNRSAIERFQTNLQTSSDRIDELHQVFARTILPPSAQEMEHILESQEGMWHEVKEDIESSRQAGVTLLGCIMTEHHSNEENTERVLTPDVEANAAELNQALNELESVESNFEMFWKSHELKIQYGLKVCLFEQEMSQKTGLLYSALGNLSTMVDFGDSRDYAESLLQELKEFEKKHVELLEKAKSLIDKGTTMMESNEQSKDRIQLKCDETRELCDKFEREVQKREEDLKKAMDIHECLEMVNKWCKTGVDLLATQPIDRSQSSEGAEKALEEIENFLKNPQGMNMAKVTEMTPMSNALGNKTLISKVKDGHKRMSEVNERLEKRETRLKKLVVKRPVQPVSGIPANPPKREEPDSFQKSGGLQRSLSEPSLRTVFVDYGSHLYFYILSSQRFREAEVCRLEVYSIIDCFLHE